MIRPILLALLVAAGPAFAQGSYGPASVAPAGAPPALEPGTRHFHVVTVHYDGSTGLQATAAHPAEAFPTAAMPPGGGLLLRAPNAEGAWSVRAFVFHPAQIVVHQGDRVALTFVDVQGPAFRIAVDGIADPIAIRRGETRTVTLTAERAGRIAFRALDQQPSMTGEILVLPR